MKNRKILILGVGEAQLNLINEARNLGYYVVVCDMRTESEGAKLADKFYGINYMDRDAVLEIARKEGIDGVISNSEPAMLTVAYVSEQLGLPGNSVKSIETLLSKTKFREVQKQVGVYAPTHYVVLTEEELFEKIQDIQYPIIIKPIESSGTRGTTKIEKFDENAISKAFCLCREFSRNNLVAIEEYVPMSSYSVNGAEIFVSGTDVFWEGLYLQNRSSQAPMVPMNEIFPAGLSDNEKIKIKTTVEKVLKETEVKLGEYNVETYFTKEGEVFIVEINPRQGGNNLPLLVKEHSGLDLTRLLVSTAVGDMSYYEEVKNFTREYHFITQQVVFSHQDGIYDGLFIAKELQPFVKWIKEEYQKGDQIVNGINAGDVVAFVDLEFEDYETQHYFTDEIEKYVYPLVRTY